MCWKFFVYVDETSQWATKMTGISEKKHFCLAILSKIAQPADTH